MTAPQFTMADMEQLVERRVSIQRSILQLWRFGNRHLASLDQGDETLFHLLVGVAFSLWRAAFLVQGERTVEQLDKDALDFLGVLSWDNAIGYSQDRSKRAWTVGYYLNNAHLRLRSAQGLLVLSSKQKEAFVSVRRFISVQNRLGNHIPDARKGWDEAHHAYRIAYTQLRKKHVPKRKVKITRSTSP